MISDDEPLSRVLWIGGGSAGGKSTAAARLAAEHDLVLYPVDDAMRAHARQLSADEAPLLHRFLSMDMDQRWVCRSPREMLETFHWFRGEGFDRIITDLRRLAAGQHVVAEGFHLLPRLVAPLLTNRHRAIWLLPTFEFRELVLRQRLANDSHFVSRTSDPARALANLLERDHLFTEQLRGDVEAAGLAWVDVDGSRSTDETVVDVANRFGLS